MKTKHAKTEEMHEKRIEFISRTSWHSRALLLEESKLVLYGSSLAFTTGSGRKRRFCAGYGS